MLAITDFAKGDKLEIIAVEKIKQGDLLWSNGETEEVRDVETGGEGYNRIDVWDKEKSLSEYIYPHELGGIKRLD